MSLPPEIDALGSVKKCIRNSTIPDTLDVLSLAVPLTHSRRMKEEMERALAELYNANLFPANVSPLMGIVANIVVKEYWDQKFANKELPKS